MVDLDDRDPFAALRSAAAEVPLPDAGAVRRRGERRTRNTRLLAATAVVVVAGTGLALTAGGSGTDTLRPPVALAPTAATPTTDASASVAPPAPTSTPKVGGTLPSRRPSPSASATAATPRLTVTLTLTSATGAAHVTYSAHVQGLVPQRWSTEPGTGPSKPVPGDELKGTTVSWGDNTLAGGSDGGAAACHPGAVLVPVSETFTEFHDFAPGTFTTTFRVDGCAVSATDSVSVTVAGPTVPTGPPTAFLPAGPVTTTGVLRAGYTVVGTAVADNCTQGSDLGIAGALRCFAGHGVYDPCFRDATSASEVLCLADPFTRSVTRLTLAAPLDPPTGSSTARPVWGLVLTGGLQCRALEGAHDSVNGRVVDYGLH